MFDEHIDVNIKHIIMNNNNSYDIRTNGNIGFVNNFCSKIFIVQ